MFLFVDIAKATQLFHSSDIAELMAEPPVAGRGRKPARGTPAVARLTHSDAGASVAEPQAVSAAARAPDFARRGQRAAA